MRKLIVYLGLLLFYFSPVNVSASVVVGKWYMNDSQAQVAFSPCAPKHGDVSEYKQAKIPAWPNGWRLAKKPKTVGHSIASTLCGKFSCRCGGKFTYFRNTLKIPKNFKLTKFEIELVGMDDGTRITIFNSKYPNGITPPGAYVFLGGSLTQDLKAYAKTGEENVIILTHVDDCCSSSNLNAAYIRINGKRVEVCVPSTEVCDAKDNNCNGQIDEGLERACSSSCGSGTQTCKNGKFQECKVAKPKKEVCDGKDNNCNGVIDDKTTCDSGNLNGSLCLCGSCAKPCKMGECPAGLFCNRLGYCVKDRCCGVSCGSNQQCKAGKCIETCKNISCGAKEVCILGKCSLKSCQNTKSKACKTDETCLSNGSCQKNPCSNKQCKEGQTCSKGKCLELCLNSSCPKGFNCKKGVCSDNSCGKEICKLDQTCQNGICKKDTCLSLTCPKSMFCKKGKCEKDLCSDVSCKMNQKCVLGKCHNLKGKVNTGSPTGPTPKANEKDKNNGKSTNNIKGNGETEINQSGGGDVVTSGCNFIENSNKNINLINFFLLFSMFFCATRKKEHLN